MKYIGICTGGPWKGQQLAHWSQSKKLYRPMVVFSMNENAPVEAVEIGEYRLNNFNQWHWWATEEGRSFDKLFGEAS